MNLSAYRNIFAATTLVLILLAISPLYLQSFTFLNRTKPFSEIWILGPTHMAEKYALNVSVNQSNTLFLSVRNHMGFSAYYILYIKFRNQSQLLPSLSSSNPSPLLPIHQPNVFLANNEAWEEVLDFKVLDASRRGDYLFLSNISINGAIVAVDRFSMWDQEYKGFYYQLFFELWMYNTTSLGFQYLNQYVGIWFNVTDHISHN